MHTLRGNQPVSAVSALLEKSMHTLRDKSTLVIFSAISYNEDYFLRSQITYSFVKYGCFIYCIPQLRFNFCDFLLGFLHIKPPSPPPPPSLSAEKGIYS